MVVQRSSKVELIEDMVQTCRHMLVLQRLRPTNTAMDAIVESTAESAFVIGMM